MSSKIEFSARIIDENGEEVIVPLSCTEDIPSIEDFLDGSNFRENFDVLEKAILVSRKDISEAVITEYLAESTKKKLKSKGKMEK